MIPEVSHADQVTRIDSDPPIEVEDVKTFKVCSARLLIFPSVALSYFEQTFLYSLFCPMFEVV